MTRPADAAHASAEVAGLGRRKFLKIALYGGAGLAALTAGGFALLRRSPVDAVPVPDHIRHLSASEYHLFSRAIEVLLPVAGSGLTPLEQVPVIEHLDHTMGLVPAAVRQDLATGLSLFDNAAVLVGLHGKRFVDLDDQQAVAYFDDWSKGNMIQKALATVVKKFVYISYWRDPATWPPVEFDGPVSDRWGVPYLGNAPLPEQDQESAV